ncbi:hypothetical protein [Aerosakkonema funiforme]|uniref:Uncharacterized protein n=1 Tax=Aerosakkonema funiforme FACHB-1375 TaxID=2949571 RepID=A0A926VFN6_9CYAN|nr:hypothetical protein [Aerosakkonema funiforme]MBD2182848.1 hypothetical protein [Aerosakkonema funiforme FACHB-1375]
MGDNLLHKTQDFLSKCFALPQSKAYSTLCCFCQALLLDCDSTINFTNVAEVDLELSQQNGTSQTALFFLYSSGGNRYIGYDLDASGPGNAVSITQFDVSPMPSNVMMFNQIGWIFYHLLDIKLKLTWAFVQVTFDCFPLYNLYRG